MAGQIESPRVDGWESALRSTPHVLEYLRDTRGLVDETIRRHRLGYDSDADAVVFPVYDQGELARIKLRYLDPAADPKTWNSAGPSCLYPDMPESRGVLLVAGDIDALTGRQMELPTVTSTTGSSLKQDLANRFARRVVYVMFDVGENRAAVRAQNRLLIGDADYVRIVQLARLGLPPKTDLNDFVVKHGGTREQIIRLINTARRSSC